MITGRHFYIAAEIGRFINHQCVVCNGLFGKRFVLTCVMSLILGFDIEKTGSSVICQNLVSIIIIGHCEFIVMSVAKTMRSGFQGQGTIQFRVCRANHGNASLVSFASVAEHAAAIYNWSSFATGNITGYPETTDCRQISMLVFVRYGEQ